MAYGTRCKNCGWQETNHVDGFIEEGQNPKKRILGYRYSLRSCPGFSSDDPKGELLLFEADTVTVDVKLGLPHQAQARIRRFQQMTDEKEVKRRKPAPTKKR